jgi:hypothetical protein
MTPPETPDEAFRRREKELEERELALRMRELESEINQPPLHPTSKHQPPETKLQRWKKQATRIALFVGIVVGVIAVIRIAAVLSSIVLVGAIAFVIYKLVLENRTKS